MRAMVLTRIASLAEVPAPLELRDVPRPVPGAGELLIQVSACGVCHTELDEIEGRTAPPRLPVILGHEVVGRVAGWGDGVTGVQVGDRVGVGWIHRSTGEPDENLSGAFQATGRDVPGGYAEFMTAPLAYSYPIPAVFSDVQAAPLLCAGAIGFRALRLTQIRDGDLLGLTGFGASAHLVLQLIRFLYPQSSVYVFARDEAQRALARELGAVWAGDTTHHAPSLLHAIIDTTPAWTPVVFALANLRPGGRLVINAIRKEDADKDALLQLSYHDHLWLEREIKSVANITRRDIAEYLPLAARIPLQPRVTTYELADANRALRELRQGSSPGARVLTIGPAAAD